MEDTVNEDTKTNRGSSVNVECSKFDIASNGVTAESEEETERHSSQCRWLLYVEIGFIIAVVIVIWSLSAVACILLGVSDSSMQTSLSTGNTSCSPRVNYQGEACKNELKEWQECFSGPQTMDSPIHIASNIDQEEMEEMANLFLGTGLLLLRPSQECEAAIRPFLCLHLFGSCDNDSQFHHTVMGDCVRIRDDLCPQEWEQVLEFLGEGVLPNCEDLSNKQVECIVSDEPTLVPNVTQNNSTSSLDNETSSLEFVGNFTCSEGFYQSSVDDDTICLPDCGDWVESNDQVGRTVVVILFALQALIASAAFLIVSMTLQRKIVFVFPTIYLVYVCIDVTVASLVMLIGFTDKEALFCGSRNLVRVLGSPTSFCTFSGIVYYYVVVQAFVWMTFLALSLCWSVVFPVHYDKVVKKGKKLVFILHITTVILGILLPLITSLIHLKDGYTIISRPTVTCNPQNVDYIFYGFVLPISFLLAVSASALFLIVYTLLKVCIKRKLDVTDKAKKDTNSINADMAHVKIVLVLFYFVFLVAFFQAILIMANDTEFTILENFFLCESVGSQVNRTSSCASTTVDNPDNGLVLFDEMNVAGMVLLLLLPLVIVIFVNGLSVKI